jgi:hypothetical protein
MKAAENLIANAAMDENKFFGAAEDDPMEMPLARPTQHHPYCMEPGCPNIQNTSVLCFTCANGYCSGCASLNQATNIIVLNSNHESIQYDSTNGGHIFCLECSQDLHQSRVIDIAAIDAQEKYTPQSIQDHGNKQQEPQLNASQLRGKDRQIITGEDLAEGYSAVKTDTPLKVAASGPEPIFAVPPLKHVRQEKEKTDRMTKKDGLVCPGCGEADCELSKTSCLKQFPSGWPQVEHLRATCDAYDGIDGKWDFVLSHARHEALTRKYMHRAYDCMDCPAEIKQERKDKGITCSFCTNVTPEILKECNVPANAIDLSTMKPHKRRGENVCGELLYQAGLTYASLHGESKRASYWVPGQVGAVETKVSKVFLSRLYNVSLSQLGRHVRDKKEGKLRSSIGDTTRKGGNMGGMEDIQCKRLETELKLVEQNPSHYKPAGTTNHPRFDGGYSRSKFWDNYCQRWDRDFHEQGKRMGHKFGLDDPRKRPSDENYLKDAEDYLTEEDYTKIHAIYQQRVEWKAEIKSLEDEKISLIATGDTLQQQFQQQQEQQNHLAKQITDNQEKYDGADDKQKGIREKMKKHHCSIKADVCYSTALRFYRRYKLLFGELKVDTCKACGK